MQRVISIERYVISETWANAKYPGANIPLGFVPTGALVTAHVIFRLMTTHVDGPTATIRTKPSNT